MCVGKKIKGLNDEHIKIKLRVKEKTRTYRKMQYRNIKIIPYDRSANILTIRIMSNAHVSSHIITPVTRLEKDVEMINTFSNASKTHI